MKKRLYVISILFLLSFIIMTVLSFTSVRRLETLINTIDKVEQTYSIMSHLDRMELVIKDIDRLERGYMITRDSNYIRLIAESHSRLIPITDKLKLMTENNREQYNNVILLRSHVVSRITHLKQNLKFADTAATEEVPVYFYKGRISMQHCMDFIQKMKRVERAHLSEYHRNKLLYQQLTVSNIKYLYLGFGALALLLMILMINALRKRIRAQEDLQIKLIDLRRSHNELEQIAFAASHDLQEPLRKIRIFVNQLLRQKKELDGDSKTLMGRINNAAIRMQELIEDLADLTSLVSDQGDAEVSDLNTIIREAMAELEKKIRDKKADIQLSELPVITGYPAQLQLLFKALLDNALKFSNEDISPLITVTASKADGTELAEINRALAGRAFHRISITDNGIGFNNKFMHKIFLLFQRLHNQQSVYEGKGAGLTLAQRVMANHSGYILAHGHPNAGASFKLYFPVEN